MMIGNSFGRYLAVGALMISVLLSGCAEKKDGSLNDLPEASAEILDNDSRDLSEEIIAPTESPSDSSLGSAEEKLTFETDESESQSSYPPDFYSKTFPPEEKENFYIGSDFRSNPQIFSCQITDESLTDDEKLEKAAYTLADEYIKAFYSDSEKCGFRILDHRNVQVTFLAHTIDRDKMIASEGENFFNTGIGDMEVSENAWIIDIYAEIRFRGQSGAFGNNDLGYGEEDWVELPNQGMSSFYLLYRIGDSYCLWSRDVYKYYRWSRDDNNYQ